MLSTIVAYLSLFFQVLAAAIAISLVKRTKFNASWILISIGFLLMVIARMFELFPAVFPELYEELTIVQHWLGFVISLVLLIGVFYIRKIFQFLRRVEAIRREAEKKVLSAVIKTEEQERQRFAKELHDGLGPLLSVVKMLVSGFEVKNTAEVNEKIKQNLKQAVDEAITSVRDISANISPHILNNFGLREAVGSFIKKLRPADGIDIKFSSNLDDRRFGYNTEVIMYRVICELINNTLRHAEADTIRIVLRLEEDILSLEYSDNGIGFDVGRETARHGMGLNNMQYRLKSGNGDIKIESERGKGMTAKAFIKLT
ncbi:sensor histidine kinase [Odoribacter lunatus]|uniref:sensor histidine kinase n=1 Tax=Odoribacter lunatus TaxID=2941335 RepID=UPI00203DF1F1|nr:ATP-binding protein [Odoribacter lunatus]